MTKLPPRLVRQHDERNAILRDATVPLALLALSFVPVVAGVVRVLALHAHDPSIEARFVGSPVPFVAHVASATAYGVLGAFQFSRGFQRRWPTWHRVVGRVLVLAGLVTATSGLAMTLTYAIPTPVQGPLLYVARLVVGTTMVAALVLGLVRIRQRDVAAHEAWMVRAYALAQGAGTQVLFLGPPSLLFGDVHGLPRDILMTAAWVANALVAERVLRSRSRVARRVNAAPTAAAAVP